MELLFHHSYQLRQGHFRPPKIAQFLSSRAYDRLIRTQPEALSTLPEKIVAAPEGQTSLFINEDNLSTNIYVTKANGMIDIKIGYVSFHSGENGVLGILKRISKLGKRNTSLNMLFPRIIAAIAQGLERLIVADPSLKTISISGSKVVNLDLTRQLRELGFEPESPGALRSVLSGFHREGGYAVWAYQLAFWTGIMGALPETMKLFTKFAKNVVIVVSAFRYSDLGRDWKIEFQVQR